MADTWTLYTRRPTDGFIEAQIDDYSTLEIVKKYNDVGTWSLTMDYRSRAAVWLNRAGSGLYVVRNDSPTDVILSGWTTEIARDRDTSSNTITFSGADDNLWLAARRVSPQPGASAPPYSSTAYDVRVGVASTVIRQYFDVNAGPGAVPARRVTFGGAITLGPDPVVGASVTGRGRWQSLLELLQELAQAGGVGFRVAHTGLGVQFQVYAPTNKSSTVQFSPDLANVASYTYKGRAPTLDHIYVGGGGEGTGRVIREMSEPFGIAAHGRLEGWADRRDTTDFVELGQEAQKQLTEAKNTAEITLSPAETSQFRYREHWDLGDLVTSYLDVNVALVEQIRAITFSFDKDGHTIRPTIGTPGAGQAVKMFSAIDRAARRITNLERR